MSVEFNEDRGIARNYGATNQVPKFAQWLISKGLSKDESGANKIQIGISIIFFALAIYFFVKM